jgi:signal transduction histidine kinase
LHDGLGPSLSGVALGLEAARSAAAGDPRRVEEILGVLHGEVGSLVAEVRQIIADLGPADVDLMAALRAHAETVTSLGVLEVRVSQSGELPVLPGAVAVAAQRIAGEAVTNVVRHAAATSAAVHVGCFAGQLVVEVTDDGTGFDEPSAGSGAGAGVGLGSMRERAESVGGVLQVASAPGRGTRVTATIPVDPAVTHEVAGEGGP